MLKSLHAGLLEAIGIVLIVALCGCNRPAGELSVKSAPPVNVQVIHAKRGEVTRDITLPGNVLAYQQATLYAKVAGYLKAISVDKGDHVQQGALLAEIEVPELAADIAKCKADVEVTEIDAQRESEAFKKAPDLVMPKTVDTAKARYLVAKANLERTETLLRYATLYAPFSGVITRRWVDPGAFIPAATSSSSSQNAALVTLADFGKVRVQVQVPEPEAPFVTSDAEARVTVEELAGRACVGRVTRYAEALDDARTMLTEIELANPKGELRPGMYASVRLVLERKQDALTLPAEALVIEKGKASVFIVAQGKAKKTAVSVGLNNGIVAEILDGVTASDDAILAGKQTLNDGQPVNVTVK